jgi:hypothetical protein
MDEKEKWFHCMKPSNKSESPGDVSP